MVGSLVFLIFCSVVMSGEHVFLLHRCALGTLWGWRDGGVDGCWDGWAFFKGGEEYVSADESVVGCKYSLFL